MKVSARAPAQARIPGVDTAAFPSQLQVSWLSRLARRSLSSSANDAATAGCLRTLRRGDRPMRSELPVEYDRGGPPSGCVRSTGAQPDRDRTDTSRESERGELLINRAAVFLPQVREARPGQ